MSYKLIIVESPVKAGTIKGYLGSPYKVVSCNGHIRDLPKNKLGIDLDKDFLPTYIIDKQKKLLVEELKNLASKAIEVFLATDADREGEAISWSLQEELVLKGEKVKRIVFREVTKEAIQKALAAPRVVDMNLVNAQQARRLLDRLVGYRISPVLWQKVKGGLSGGRVQSVAVRIIVDRERAIDCFVPVSYFKAKATLMLSSDHLLEAVCPDQLLTYEEASTFAKNCREACFVIHELKETAITKSPPLPFITSTLQQEASQKYGFSVSQTMVLAQLLYEKGYITYMRTDSLNFSDEAKKKIKAAITDNYGSLYYQKRTYKAKSTLAQEAHEAIRPTNFQHKIVSKDKNVQKLYTLIWQRTLASQMADAKLDKTMVIISSTNLSNLLQAKGEVITFPGYLAAYQDDATLSAAINALPPLQVGQTLSLRELQVCERFTTPPARYTEATLVKQLEEKGIGRPSTYAPIVSIIQRRGYVLRKSQEGKERSYRLIILREGVTKEAIKKEIVGSEKNKLFPTDMGMIVNDFLVESFPDITNYAFTANVEKQLDNIAQEKKLWQEMLSHFYKDFSSQVERASKVDSTAAIIRTLGKDPKTGKPVIVRLSKRYGPLVQLGGAEDGGKPRFVSLRPGQFLERITLEEALYLFELPREVGTFEGASIIANIGKYGPYIEHKSKCYPLGEELDPYTIEEAKAVEWIQAKRETEAKKIIKVVSEELSIIICNGKYGPYIKTNSKNIKIPKGKDVNTLTLQDCLDLVEQSAKTKTRSKKK